MNIFTKIYGRTFQKTLFLASLAIPEKEPELIKGVNSFKDLPNLLISKNLKSVLVITTNGMHRRGTLDDFKKEMDSKKIDYQIYDKTVPNPTIENVETALEIYKKHNAEAIIAVGGGSVMDCAKLVAARVAKPNKTVSDMKGLFKIMSKIPTLIAVPTTAGSGSETTIAAVISDPDNNTKYAVSDFSLVPHYAVLDPVLTVGLSKSMTATTGMDALTHAVEAYIGKSNTPNTKKNAEKAVKLIFANLTIAYNEPDNLQARENMQRAAFHAGIAFTRAYVGYVHAIAHSLGGLYGVAHGLANAVILPIVLEEYGQKAYKPLAKLADIAGICKPNDTTEVKANLFINAIKDMNRSFDIPEKIKELKEEDIESLAKHAIKEGNPLYPVPEIWDIEKFKLVYYRLLIKQ